MTITFDEARLRDAILEYLGSVVFEGRALRASREGGELRPPCVTATAPRLLFDRLGEGSVCRSGEWPLHAYVAGVDEARLAELVRVVLDAVAADRSLGGAVRGAFVTEGAEPELVEVAGPTVGRAGRKMLRRRLTLQTTN